MWRRYEHVPVSFRKESKTPEYLGINPNGRVPALRDGELLLFESMAINWYLAKHYGADLYPRDPQDEARALQWSVWVIAEMERSPGTAGGAENVYPGSGSRS